MAWVHSKTIEATKIERIDYNMSVKPELKGVMVDQKADGGSGEEKLDGQRRGYADGNSGRAMVGVSFRTSTRRIVAANWSNLGPAN